jgi:hypothetical protein
MSLNIVSLISQYLTPDMIAKIAAALGVDQSLAGKAVTAAIPGLLGGLTGVAGTQEGSQKLYQAVTQQHPGVLDNLAGLIGGSEKAALVEAGSRTLSSLFGSSAVSALGGAVAQYAGLGGAAGSSLLGLLAPVVMGTLGKQASAGSLDAGGLASLLSSQKSNIAAALPSGFASLLGGTGLLSSLGANVSGAGQTAKAAVQSVSSSADRAAQEASGLPGWARWALPLIAVAALGWWFLGDHSTNVADQAKTAATGAAQVAQSAADSAKSTAMQGVQSLQNLVVGGVDVGSSIQKTVAGLKTSLQSVKDADSAKAALPGLQDASAQIDKLNGLLNQLPASGRTAIATFIASVRPTLDDLFNKVLAIPGVAEVAKPTIDTIKARLDVLAKG